MAQGVFPFKYESEKKITGMTALGGLPAYMDIAQVVGLSKSVQKYLKVRAGGQGWTDAQMVLSLTRWSMGKRNKAVWSGPKCVSCPTRSVTAKMV